MADAPEMIDTGIRDEFDMPVKAPRSLFDPKPDNATPRPARTTRSVATDGEREAVFLIGMVLLSIGAFFVYAPASLIVPGAILTFVGAVSLLGRRSPGRGGSRQR